MIIDELVTLLGMKVSPSASSESQRFGGMLSGIGTNALAAGAAITAMFGSIGVVAAINTNTTQFDQLAKSVGSTTEQMKAYEAIFSSAGFNAEHVGSLIEEMNNKIGESTGLAEQITPVKEAMQILGLSFDEVSKKSPDEQFRMIASAAQEMTDAQKAQSAVDILMGGEANRLIGVLRNKGESFESLINSSRRYNLLTDEGIEGAEKSAKSTQQFRQVITSLGADLAGRVGGAVSGFVDGLNNIIIANSDIARSGFTQVVAGITQGLTLAGEAVDLVLDVIKWLATELSDATGIVVEFGDGLDIVQPIAIATAIIIGKLAIAAISAAAPFLLAAAAIAAVILALDDLWTFFHGGDSVIGDFVNIFKEEFPDVTKVLSYLAEIVGKALPLAWEGLKNIVALVIDSLMMAVQPFVDIIEMISEGIESIFKSDLVQKAGGWIKEKFGLTGGGFDAGLKSSHKAEIPAHVANSTANNQQLTVNQQINGAVNPQQTADSSVNAFSEVVNGSGLSYGVGG